MSNRLPSLVLLCLALVFGAPQMRAEISLEVLTGAIGMGNVDEQIALNQDQPRVVFDLLAVKAGALVDQAQFAEAARTVTVQVAYALRYPDEIAADDAALLLDAADLFEQAGDTQAALVQLYAALDALRSRAADADIIAALLNRIATLEETQGRPEVAAQLRTAARNVPAPTDEPAGTRSDDPGFVRLDVYYATDRADTGNPRPERRFGSERADALNLGIAEVTIPRDHVPGAVEAPSVWRLQFTEDPVRHVMLQSLTPVDADGFFGKMRADLADSGATDAFVFVHGFNVSFDEAVKRTAQLAHDMNFRGLPVLYSWPSKGATVGYIQDTAVVRLSGRRLTHFLEDVVQKSGARTIHLIAHSMGNRAMTDALELMALRHAPDTMPIFDQVIFAAPDVDMGLFAAMLSTIRPIARRLTLYASDQDWALEASRKLHGNYPRAGQGGDLALMNDRIDTIDMSDLGTDMLAHSYVANEQSALLDISMLFWRNLDPQSRCGLAATVPDAAIKVWKYARARCSDLNLLPVVATLRDAGAATREQVLATLRRSFPEKQQVVQLEDMLLELAAD